jgi:hypothetical protein
MQTRHKSREFRMKLLILGLFRHNFLYKTAYKKGITFVKDDTFL